jgi:hypothetical protein
MLTIFVSQISSDQQKRQVDSFVLSLVDSLITVIWSYMYISDTFLRDCLLV